MFTNYINSLDTNLTLGNCLFGSVELTKNAGKNENKFSRYGTEFDFCSKFFFSVVMNLVKALLFLNHKIIYQCMLII